MLILFISFSVTTNNCNY